MILKNLINQETVQELSNRIKQNYSDFDQSGFQHSVISELSHLELMERIFHISNCLQSYLPGDFETSAKIIVKSKGVELPNNDLPKNETPPTGNFIMLSLCHYIAQNGIQHFDVSMWALEELTKTFSSEMAIRTFIINNQNDTMKQIALWAQSKNRHVRRLASEGCRPRLPWAQRLPAFMEDPSPILSILETLKDDPSLYVRRSVANNLNDISKDNPETVIELCEKWIVNCSKNRLWVIQHALRSLMKQGNPRALKILGYKPSEKILVKRFLLTKDKINLGDCLEFNIAIQNSSKKSQKVMLDYIVYHIKANGKKTPKVFKLKNRTLKPNEEMVITKSHPFKTISTRTYYSGKHEIQIQINGLTKDKLSFHLNTQKGKKKNDSN